MCFCSQNHGEFPTTLFMNTPFLSTTYIYRSPGRPSLLLILLLTACAAFSQTAQAVTPPPDGGYPGGNTAEGQNALSGLTTGAYNTGVGFLSLLSNTEGQFNTAVGAGALLADVGSQDAFYGSRNTAIGAAALLSNTTGSDNTANGAFALLNNMSYLNSAFGSNALMSNVIGLRNTAVGSNALLSNTVGDSNTAIGDQALYNNVDGSDNTAVGAGALMGNFGSGNIALGAGAGTGISGASGVIAIGSVGGIVSNTCFIGKIRDVTTQFADAIPVVIDSSDQLGTMSSSRRFKQDIKSMDKASEAILALKPVTFHYKSDTQCIAQFGLVAEEVAEVNPNLVVRDKNGAIYTVRYDAVNAMLLNEFLKEHRKVEQLKKEFESKIAEQQRQIELLASGLEKMNARLEPSKSAPQVVLSNR
jgi:hypothetical protein